MGLFMKIAIVYIILIAILSHMCFMMCRIDSIKEKQDEIQNTKNNYQVKQESAQNVTNMENLSICPEVFITSFIP